MTKYNFEFKKKVVLEYINENISIRSLAKKYDIKSHNNIEIWVAKDKKYGDDGLYRSRKNEEYPFEKKIYVVELYLTSELSYNDLALQEGINNAALIISAAPFYARLVEIGLREVDKGVIEAARAMGAKKTTIILKVLIPESLPAIISGLTVTAIALVGSTAMAGVIGAGGLGNLAYLDGFQRNNSTLTFVATVLILIIVFALQILGDTIVKKVDKR